MLTQLEIEKVAVRPFPHRVEPMPTGVNGHAISDEPYSEAGRRVSEEVYWAHYYEHPDFSYEWNDGILEEKPVPDYERVTMYGWFQMLLRCYLEAQPIAKMLFLETGFRLAMPHKTTIRKPDLFVVRNDNPVPLGTKDRSYKGICDLCVESLSDSTQGEIDRDTVVKKQEYALIGVHEYYILDPGEHMLFYRRTPAGDYDEIAPDVAGVIRSEVLPGFQFRITDLYRQPSLIQMAEDPVYQDFVLLEYQSAKAQADQTRLRLRQEQARAERLAAQLRALGVEPEA